MHLKFEIMNVWVEVVIIVSISVTVMQVIEKTVVVALRVTEAETVAVLVIEGGRERRKD